MAIHLDPVSQVWGITGHLGGGKSLTAVCLAAHAMRHGYFVVSNITLNLDNLCSEIGPQCRHLYQHFSFAKDTFDPFLLPTGSPRGTLNGKRVLVIMDECAEWIDQYTSAHSDPKIKRFLSWLRHSSKRSQDVILIVQRLDYMNKSIRLLVSKWVVVDDLRVWRLPVVKCRLPFLGGFCMQRVFNSHKQLVQGPHIVNKASFGRFYRTAECLNEDGAQYDFEYVAPRISDVALWPYLLLFGFSAMLLFGSVSAYQRKYDAICTNYAFLREAAVTSGIIANIPQSSAEQSFLVGHSNSQPKPR